MSILEDMNAPQMRRDRNDLLISGLCAATAILTGCAIIGLLFILPSAVIHGIQSAAIPSPL